MSMHLQKAKANSKIVASTTIILTTIVWQNFVNKALHYIIQIASILNLKFTIIF